MRISDWSSDVCSSDLRVRIALALKQVAHESRPVSLLDDAQHGADNLAINPQGFVPTLEVDGTPLVQSLAIIDWLDTTFPEPPLHPREPVARAQALARALVLACAIPPLDNPIGKAPGRERRGRTV